MNRIRILVVSLTLVSAPAVAEPGRAFQYLIEEPASLFDVGFIRLNQYLDDRRDLIRSALDEQGEVTRFSTVQIAAEYSAVRDEIMVVVAGFTTEALSEDGCRDVVTVLRATVPDLLANSFRHYGYESEDQPEDLVEELQQQTRLVCSIHRPMSPRAMVEVSEQLVPTAEE